MFIRNKAVVGEETPSVSAKLVSGEDFKLSDLKGKTVYLVFWGSWCPPCRAELPHWVDFYNANNDPSVEVVSIALEKKAGQASRVSDKLNFPWKYQIEEVSGFVATNEFSRKYGVSDIPAAFKINPDGTLAEKLSAVPAH
jgi:thiol-disulfide isomerase/thioredoxin